MTRLMLHTTTRAAQEVGNSGPLWAATALARRGELQKLLRDLNLGAGHGVVLHQAGQGSLTGVASPTGAGSLLRDCGGSPPAGPLGEFIQELQDFRRPPGASGLRHLGAGQNPIGLQPLQPLADIGGGDLELGAEAGGRRQAVGG